jgi:Fe-Mn family superoxide dismutase
MEHVPSRRAVLAALGAGGAALATGREAFAQASASEAVRPPAFRGQHAPKPLPFDPAKLKGLSEKLVRSHWENNYGGAVKALNAVEQRLDALLADKDLPAYVYGDLKREELVRTGSVVLHEHYFANLGGDGKPSGTALELVKRWFGSFERWELEFKRTANALAGGSGWVVLALNLHTGGAHHFWAGDHSHAAVLGAPLLVLDMYEHSCQWTSERPLRRADTFMENVLEEVGRRAEWALKARRVILPMRRRRFGSSDRAVGFRAGRPAFARAPGGAWCASTILHRDSVRRASPAVKDKVSLQSRHGR